MPSRETSVSKLFEQTDTNGVVVGKWAKPHNQQNIWCTLCAKSVSISSGGMWMVNQHAKGTNHKQLSTARFSDNQPRFSPSSSSTLIKPLNERVLEAEILWAFKVAEEDWSFRSCDNLDKLFGRMFHSEESAKFGMAHTKASYAIRHGLGPEVVKELALDLEQSTASCYTLMLDETTTAQVKKQCDFIVRFWSDRQDEVCTRYLTSKMFGHTSADHLKDLVMEVVDDCDLPVTRLANISTDGPNINVGLHKRLDAHLKEKLEKGIAPFNPCPLHKCHNGFHKGIIVYGKGAENLAFDLHAWFKLSPCKREDFMEVAADLQDAQVFEVFERNEALFYRHVETRWLTLSPALVKVEDRWEESKEYFLVFLPSTKDFERHTASNKRYVRIADGLKDEYAMRTQIAFVIDVATPFQKFLTVFQTDHPMIHVLFDEMKLLLVTVMQRFLKVEAVSGLSGKQLLSVNVKDDAVRLDASKMVIGAKTERFLKKLSPFEQKRERGLMAAFFVAVTSYLQKMLPLGDNLLIAATALNPCNRKKKFTEKAIVLLAKSFPHVIFDEDVSLVQDEWKLFQGQSDEQLLSFDNGMRVDHWWRTVFNTKSPTGEKKFPYLEKVVKSTLALHCGNSAVERSLSDNKRTVDAERDNLLDQTIINLRRMKEYARSCGGAENVVVTDKMLKGMASAKAEDEKRLKLAREAKEVAARAKTLKEEEERRKEEMVKKAAKSKKKLEEKEALAQKDEDRLDEEIEVANRALSEANKSLKLAVEKKDHIGMKVACDLVDSSQKKIEAINEMRKEQSKGRDDLRKKRKSTIANMFESIKKKKNV